MLKHLLTILIFIFSINSIFAANVDLNLNVGIEETIFEYNIIFNSNETYDSFSFEKPKDSTILFAKNDLNETLFYSVAGDYFIFKTENTNNQKFTIKFITKTTSKILNEEDKFNTYINFNFPVEKFDFKVNFEQKYETIEEIFPREYTILENGKFNWILNNLERDSLFLINFNNKILISNISQDLDDSNTKKIIDKYIIIIIVISSIFLIVIIVGIRKIINIISDKKKEEKTQTIVKTVSNSQDGDNDKNEIKEIIISEEKTQIKETFEEFIVKYLTENEKEVVLVIVDNEGLLQNEILNFIPQMKKSNLSKIITKLHSKRILNRIKVGKVNKIHIGEKLQEILDNEKKN